MRIEFAASEAADAPPAPFKNRPVNFDPADETSQ